MPYKIRDDDDLELILKKIRSREESLKKLEELSNLGSWEVDVATKTSIWSDNTYNLYGVDRSVQPNLAFFSRLSYQKTYRWFSRLFQTPLSTDASPLCAAVPNAPTGRSSTFLSTVK